MNFQDELRNLMDGIDGARAAILMGFDGLPVAEARSESGEVPSQDAGVEYCALLGQAVKIAQGNQLGALSEMVLSTENHRLVFRVLNSQYLLCLMTGPESNLGKARFVVRRAAPDFAAEL